MYCKSLMFSLLLLFRSWFPEKVFIHDIVHIPWPTKNAYILFGIIFQKLINKNEKLIYILITIIRVLSFVGEILSKIRKGVLSILPHSSGIYYSNSHVDLWTYVMKCIGPQHWAISNNGFRSDSFYEKKIGEDLVFNNALPKSLTINTSRVSKGKTKIA